MMEITDTGFYHNGDARKYIYQTQTYVSPRVFHSQLPDFKSTPLRHVPPSFFGFNHVYIKDESERLGLPSFKILGASWGTFRSIAKAYGLPLDSKLEDVRHVAQQSRLHLVTATEGNHGRAVARMARLLGVEATVFVPETVNDYTRNLIRGEGVEVLVEPRGYDAGVITAHEYAKKSSNRLCVQDTSFEDYHEIPTWIVQGYTTMLSEVEEQLRDLGLKATHIFTPVGVGSLAHAVVVHSKSEGRGIAVISVESEWAACLQHSLYAGVSTPITTHHTIMDGINCSTVSDISWPILKDGVDVSVTISDLESHSTVLQLAEIGINAGPCGASTSAALRKLAHIPEARAALGLSEDSVIVLLNTEGSREYMVPT